MSDNTKNDFFLAAFKLSSSSIRWNPRILSTPIRLGYKLLIQWVLGIDIPDTLNVGKGFRIFHGVGIVIHESCIIGDFVTIRHNTTIGNAHPGGGVPHIGNHVDIGANSVILGEITVGDHSIIAAGSVVIRNVPPNVVVAGNPAKIVKVLK
jgi:putative colanic acid biosynthesis acetyltransferase WcaB